MPDSLVLRLPRDDASHATAITAIEGRLAPVTEQGAPEIFATRAASKQVIVLVPATEVVLTEAVLPVRGKAKMQQAVPYALEDQIAEDVSGLHFALGPRGADNRVPTAVVALGTIQSWIARLEAAGIQATAMIPEQMCVPGEDDTHVLLLTGDDALLAMSGSLPLGCDATEVPAYLGILAAGDPAHSDESEDAPAITRLDILVSEDDESRHAALIETLRGMIGAVRVRTFSGSPLRLMAERALNDDGSNLIDLLQGAFSRRTATNALWRPWRGAAMLAIGVMAATLGVKSVQWMQLSAQDKQLSAQIQEVYRSSCPGAGPIVMDQIRLQMRNCVAAALSGGAQGDQAFLDTLGAFSAVMTASADTRIEALSFRNRVLDVKMTAPDVETLDRIKRSLADNNGLEMEIESANPRDGVVQSQVAIRSPGA